MTHDSFRDTAEQMRADDALRPPLTEPASLQHDMYESVLNAIPDFIYVFSLDHRVLYANDALIRMWGRGRDGAIGRTFLEIGYEPWHAALHEREIDEVRATRQPIRGVVPFSGADGTRQYEYIFVPIIGPDGDVSAVAGTTRDITERVLAEEELRASEARHNFLVTLADTMRPLSDPLEVQAAASRVLGEQLGANRVVYFEIRGDDYVIEHDYVAGVPSIVGHHAVDAFGPGHLAMYRAGRTVIEVDTAAHPSRSVRETQAFSALQIRACVCVPLIKDHGLVAVLAVQSASARIWTANEIAMIEDAAERTWAAVERARVEAALRQSEERSAFVRRSSGVGFWYCDLPFDVLQWDELVKAHFHLPGDAHVTIETFYDRIHPDDREPTREAIARSITERTHYNTDYRTVDPGTGAVRWVRAIGRTLYATDGTPTQFDGITLDVTEQKRAEASLRESERRFRLVADAAPVMIWKCDADMHHHWFNQPFLAFTGRSMEEELGSGWLERVHPDDVHSCVQASSDAVQRRQPFSREYRLRRHDGEFRWLIDHGVPRYGSAGEFDGYIGSCVDVSDYKNAEARLRDADNRKDEFLATLAHELRNPLAPIRNGLHILRLSGTSEPTERISAMMDRQITQLVRLVDDLLDVSRVRSDKLGLRLSTVELRSVIEAAVETSQPLIEGAGHELTVVMPDESLMVHGDDTRLAQVISNLLNNSAKFTNRGGRIRLVVSRDGDEAVVSVADNGIGIPVPMLGAVFERFTQVDRSLEKVTGGLGIGLSLVKGLVEMHGGRVEARSDGEGRGSEFLVRLPLEHVLNRSTNRTPE